MIFSLGNCPSGTLFHRTSLTQTLSCVGSWQQNNNIFIIGENRSYDDDDNDDDDDDDNDDDDDDDHHHDTKVLDIMANIPSTVTRMTGVDITKTMHKAK